MKKNGFGGFSFSSLNLDDFTGSACHKASFPLLTAASGVLVRPSVAQARSAYSPVKQSAAAHGSTNASHAAVDSAPKKRKKRLVSNCVYNSYTHTHTYTHTYITLTHTRTHTHTHTHTYTHTYSHTHTLTHTNY